MSGDKQVERYEAFIKTSLEGIWLFETDKPIPTSVPTAEQIRLMYKYAYMAEANDALAKMYSVNSRDELIGVRLGDFLIEGDPRNIELLTAFIESGYSLTGVESYEKDAQGNDKYFRNSLVGIVEDGKLLRAWGTQQDITDQMLTTEALKHGEERLTMALKATATGIWEWDVQSDALTWTDELKVLFGLKPSEGITYQKYVGIVHPKDRRRLQQVIRHAMKDGDEYMVEHRIIWPDKSEHWILSRGKAYLKNGKPVRMIGTAVNIDERKHAEAQAEESRRTKLRQHELEEINFKLKQQQRQLVALNRSKDEFISLASHQLRTPATGVKQYLGLLLEGYMGHLDADQRSMLEIANDSNERQLTIINDLLRVAQVDAGRVVLRRVKIDLVNLLAKVIDEQSAKFKHRHQTITLLHPKTKATANIDPHRIRMVFENLIDNASKYTPEGKSVTVNVSSAPAHVTVAVADEGIGISKKDMPKLFQKFSRLDSSLTNAVSGTGLGLYWAKKIITLHGGTLTVESTLRKGTTFTVTIPKS